MAVCTLKTNKAQERGLKVCVGWGVVMQFYRGWSVKMSLRGEI